MDQGCFYRGAEIRVVDLSIREQSMDREHHSRVLRPAGTLKTLQHSDETCW
jgi:hypothetical protein